MSDFEIAVTEMPANKLPEYISALDQATRDWTDRAARGECPWVCADCCYTFKEGMPDQCCHGLQECTEIIKRDKLRAMREGNEPS
ncbi:hypothetical protein [Pseudomonas sp. UBA5568]|uniref:hypothetical protein n=1 Tax=Pseudomonas sp. UBA5568 TaxID=1947319 RepID=UPI00259A9EBB|nr:hypothetical protein [Pseudomonas sp. UBA5568]